MVLLARRDLKSTSTLPLPGCRAELGRILGCFPLRAPIMPDVVLRGCLWLPSSYSMGHSWALWASMLVLPGDTVVIQLDLYQLAMGGTISKEQLYDSAGILNVVLHMVAKIQCVTVSTSLSF